MLKLTILSLLAVDGQVTPCGAALCIGGNQQPITLGGTVQISQSPRPDGGLASVTPVVSGASLDLRGTQSDPPDGGSASAPDVILGSRNSAAAARTLVSVRSNQAEVWSIKGDGTTTTTAAMTTGPVTTSFVDAGALAVAGVPVAPVSFSVDYDFPACTAGDTQVSKDKALTANGVTLGAPCVVGVLQATPADGGSAYVQDSIFTVVATKANTIELRQFCTGADAGIRNAPDSGYRGYCFN